MTFADITEQVLLFFATGFIAGVIFGRVIEFFHSFGR